MLYAIVVICLGLLVLILELPNIETLVETRWNSMSRYQKDFFDGDKSKLEDVRRLNTMLAGLFAMFVGVLLLIVSCFTLKFCSLIGDSIKFDKSASSRLPEISPSTEQVVFRGHFQLTKEND